jgi:predicted GH43/DUF377 family glycosyl hydrolase
MHSSAQNFILETKRIKLDEYPYAFNPSIVRWRGKLLMSFRVIPNAARPFQCWTGVVWLDENFHPACKPQKLDTRYLHPKIPCRTEDARLIIIEDRLYMVYSDNTHRHIQRGGFRVYVAEIHFDGTRFSVKNIDCLTKFEGENKNRREKNWVPFEYEGELLLAYSLVPHLIFLPMGKGKCETVASTKSAIPWEWGELRGGTPGVKIGKTYLAFFHSSKLVVDEHQKKTTQYYIGAYTFSSDPPFEITHASPKPLMHKKFYDENNYKPYWKPVNVVFPGGFIIENNVIWMAYGRQDHEIWVAKINAKELLDSLSPVAWQWP